MRILVFVDQMAVGGASRVASIMLQGLVDLGHDVMIETDISYGVFYDIPSSVKLAPVQYSQAHNYPGRIKQVIRRINGHRKYINEFNPDVIIVYMSRLFIEVLIANAGKRIPIIVTDHTSMSRDLGAWTNFVRHNLYGLADCATILTKKDETYLGKRIKCKEVVYNPLTFQPIRDFHNPRRKNILCVGRVSYWNVKGFDRIIKIWGGLSRKYPEWILEIAGPYDSSSLRQLSDMALKAGCANQVKFLGNIKDIISLYTESSIFALPSRVEGFPMVLIEAMSQGCACISFDMDGAISEIAKDQINCSIVPDNNLELFGQKLEHLLNSEELRDSLSINAIKDVDKYNVDSFIEHWHTILTKVSNGRSPRK